MGQLTSERSTSPVFSSKFGQARRGHRSAEVRSAVAGALALTVAMPSVAEAPTQHRGTGIARREAFHERQRAERAELEAAGDMVLPAEEEVVVVTQHTNNIQHTGEVRGPGSGTNDKQKT